MLPRRQAWVRRSISAPTAMNSSVTTVEAAVLSDLTITERQKRVLIDVYQSFVKENEKDGGASAPAPETAEPTSKTSKNTTQGE